MLPQGNGIANKMITVSCFVTLSTIFDKLLYQWENKAFFVEVLLISAGSTNELYNRFLTDWRSHVTC